MADDWPYQPDSFDTLRVPFVFIPEGASEPVEWLADHPTHIRVPATFVPSRRSRGHSGSWRDRSSPVVATPSDGATAEVSGSFAPVGVRGRRRWPPPPEIDRSGYLRETPVAAYLRANEMFVRLGAVRHDTRDGEEIPSVVSTIGSAAGGDRRSAVTALGDSSHPDPIRRDGALKTYAHVDNDPPNLTHPSELRGQMTDLARWGLMGAAIGGVCAVAEPCGVGVAVGTAIGAAAVATGAIILNNKDNGGQQQAQQPSSGNVSVEDLIGSSTPGRATKGPTNQYDRPGGYSDAQEDFNSLGPTNVHPAQNNPDAQIGILPDGGTVTVRPTSTNGRPTLEIYNPATGRSIKIRYGN